jgi:hypothetical protein
LNSYRLPKPLPMWLNPAYAKHIVKGNFMTLSSRPKTVELGEWIAHQGLPSPAHRLSFVVNPVAQWLSIIATSGPLSRSFAPRRRTGRASAMLRPAPGCPLDRKVP